MLVFRLHEILQGVDDVCLLAGGQDGDEHAAVHHADHVVVQRQQVQRRQLHGRVRLGPVQEVLRRVIEFLKKLKSSI